MSMLFLSNESMEKVEKIVEEEDNEMGGIRSELLRWYNEGKRESLEEGRQSGLRDGRNEGKKQMLLKILPKKLGTELPNDVVYKIENATDDVVMELEDNIFNFATVEDVERILA